MIDNVLAIIAALSPLILGYLGYVFKLKFQRLEIERKKEVESNAELQNKNSEQLKTIVKERITVLEQNVEKIQSTLNDFIADDDFKITFKNTIRIKASNVIQLVGSMLPDGSSNILSYWSEVVEHFGLDFFYSTKRKASKKEKEEYLTTTLNIHIANFYQKIDVFYKEKKKNKGHRLSFSEFLEKMIIHKKTEVLKETLIKNGLSRSDLIDVFSEYIEEFTEELIKAIQVWESFDL